MKAVEKAKSEIQMYGEYLKEMLEVRSSENDGTDLNKWI